MQITLWVWGYVLFINIITLCFFLFDKIAAAGRVWRVPEYVLFLLLILGGTPAGFVAMRLFRHKTRKDSFQAVVLLILCVQVALLFLFFKDTYIQNRLQGVQGF
jgi:uncharacterized membrane protein YsdA (DUF1294 family)